MTSLDERLRAYLHQRARELPSAIDREQLAATALSRKPLRPGRGVVALSAGTLVIAGAAMAGVLVIGEDDSDPGEVRAGPVTTAGSQPTDSVTPDPQAPFTWPDSCLRPAEGSNHVSPELLPGGTTPSWTASEPGAWLRTRLLASGLTEPYSAGSAWVVMHGVDGALLAWIGPPGDTANLPLQPVDGVESTEISPESPFERGVYRPAIVDSMVGGGVRLWFVTHPRNQWDSINGPGLTTAPCLPDQSAIRQALRQLAAAAEQDPYRGQLPETAGRLRINPDGGVGITGSGSRHLSEVGSRALGRSLTAPGSTALTLDGNDVFVYATIPPSDTDSARLIPVLPQGVPDQPERPVIPHVAAGGVDVVLWVLGGAPPDQVTTDDLRRIAVALNRDPFLGQPTLS